MFVLSIATFTFTSALWVSRQPIAIDDEAPGFIHEEGFSSVNYNNVYGR